VKAIPQEIITLFRGLAIFAAISIEKFRLVEQMLEKERMDRELQIAKEIQQSFLLSGDVSISGLDVAFVNIPSSAVGGDYYDIISLSDHEKVFTINDISGHGVPASLIMSIFRANFTYRIKRDRDMGVTINHLNKLLAETTEPNLYVTSFTCLIDTKQQRLQYINCGHVRPFIVRGEEIVKLEEGGTVLGMFPDLDFQPVTTNLEKKDLIAFFTDGIIEAENPKGEQYSLERLAEFMKRNNLFKADFIKKKFIEELKQHTGKDNFEDDVTFMIVKCDPE
jgi:serine phosphatase RsbU (regulator of sigma subunit)